MRGEGVAAQILIAMGADLSRVRQQVVQLLSGFAGPSGSTGTVASLPRNPPTCVRCRSSLKEHARWRRISVASAEEGGEPQEVVVVYCGRCGDALDLRAP